MAGVMTKRFQAFNVANGVDGKGLKFSGSTVVCDGTNPSAAIDTGLTTVLGCVATVQGATAVATAVVISGGTITVEAAGAASVTVSWLAWGY